MTPQIVAAAKVMRADGKTYDAIAAVLRVSRGAVHLAIAPMPRGGRAAHPKTKKEP